MTTSTLNYVHHFNANNHTSPESSNINWFMEFDYFRFNEDGSFTCKISDKYKKQKDHSLILALFYNDSLDFELCGEDGCAGNWDMYSPFYNPMTGLLYLVLHTVCDKFMNGEEVTVYGREVDEEELQEIYDWISRS